jgi:hypothetical protein
VQKLRKNVGKVAIVALLLVGTGALAESSTAAESPKVARPFLALLNGFAAPTAAPRCDALALALSASGFATQMGAITVAGTHCTEPTLTQQAVPFWSGLATFTASDGSSIEVSYRGHQDAPAAGKARFGVVAQVVSGTGRFDGATGSFAGAGVIDFATFSVRLGLAGRLVY